MPTLTNPHRFIDKAFIRRRTYVGARNDYVAVIDGLVAGRIMQQKFSFGSVRWQWSVTGPYLPPELVPGNGQEQSLDRAQEAFKTKFWQWHSWALQQPRGTFWHGEVR